MEQRTLRIGSEDEGTRLDRFIRRHLPGINQGKIEKLLRSGSVRIDGAKAKSSARLIEGQKVEMPAVMTIEHGRPADASPLMDDATIALVRDTLITRGEGWIALNKPSGLATQGGSGTRQHVDGALASAFPGEEKPRLVHRLDRDTSGVLIVATTLAASRALARAFQRHDHEKTYLALVLGVPKPYQGIIDAPLIKAGGKGQEKMAVDHDKGQHARTLYSVMETMGKKASLVALRPLTGRTHQLRVHMAAIGCPILGDGKYGGSKTFPHASISRLCLHAAHLVLHTGEPISATVSDDLKPAFDFFGLDVDDMLNRAADPALFPKDAS
jgi:23S rRNA pseudouridine955/2504/2580 synthase